jgi:protein-tyrosine phosphatase
VIDLHSHVLPGIDDGPATLEGSMAIARAAAEAGIRTIVATPHVSSRHRNDSDTIARVTARTRERLRDERIELELLPGAEIALTHLAELDPGELERLGLGGGPWLLVEPPFTTPATGLQSIVQSLIREGHRVVLAHPERCPAFQREPRQLESLVNEGALTSVTAGSLVGRFGGDVRQFALALLESEMVHNVASDAHDHERRAPGIALELERAGYGALREWLTEEVPAAILSGAEIPPRPATVPPRPRPRRASWRRRP